MNRLNMTVRTLTLIVILIVPCAASAATGTFGGSGGGGSSTSDPTDNDNVPKITGSLEQVVTVTKNEVSQVTGNLFCSLPFDKICPDSEPLSLELQSSPIGQYGSLEVFANGKFRYVLKNDLAQVQALGFHEVAEEVFYYEVKEGGNAKTNGQLTVFILGNPSVSFDNVEIEFNNESSQANAIHAGDALKQGQYMRGQLITPSDRDWFLFNSLGNEIINLELCPEGSQCVDENAWVMYVFDADKLEQRGDEFKTFPLRRYVKETGEVLNTVEANHMYLLLDKGIFKDSLIGLIDPCFGDRRTLDIGVGEAPKNYLVAVTSALFREDDADGACGSGDVVLEEEISAVRDDTNVTIVEEFLTAVYSDDQYTLKVTRTGADPFAVIQPLITTFDAVGRKVDIPKMRINNELFSVELEEINAASFNTPATYDVLSIESLNEPLTPDPYLPTYNPANQIVKIPQVLIQESGDIYSVELLYQPEESRLLLLKAEQLN